MGYNFLKVELDPYEVIPFTFEAALHDLES
jgi:hypothetical protein